MKRRENIKSTEEDNNAEKDSQESTMKFVNGPYFNCRLPPDGYSQTIGRWFAYGRRNSERHIRRVAPSRE